MKTGCSPQHIDLLQTQYCPWISVTGWDDSESLSDSHHWSCDVYLALTNACALYLWIQGCTKENIDPLVLTVLVCFLWL